MRLRDVLLIGAGLGTAAVMGVGLAAADAALSRRTPVVNVTDPADVGWVTARIEACERVCGELMPFEVEATKDSFRCTCQRPGTVAKVRLPGPPVRVPSVAQGGQGAGVQ